MTDPQPISWDPDVLWEETEPGREVLIYRKGGPIKAFVNYRGTLEIHEIWKLHIGQWMAYDPKENEAFRERYNLCLKLGKRMIEDGVCYEEALGLGPFVPKGVKEWRPPRELGPDALVKKDIAIGGFLNGLRYIHFVSPKGHGLAILSPDKPEVWYGDAGGFIEFMDRWTSRDQIHDANSFLSNGLLWVIDYCFGFFGDPYLFSYWPWDLVKKNPDLLWPDLVGRIKWLIDHKPDRVHPWLKETIEEWIRRHGEPHP